MKLLISTVIAAAALSSQAQAKPYKMTLTGTVGAINAVDRNFQRIETPASTIAKGDIFKVSFSFDTKDQYVTGLFDLDPTINIYYGSMISKSLSIGSFSYVVPTSFASFQLWDNYKVGGTRETDLFSVNSGTILAPGQAPFAFGNQTATSTFSFSAFDGSATARTNDLISQITPLSGFNGISLSAGFVAADYTTVAFSVSGVEATLSSAVPEPSTWALMIIGFGAVGGAMRRRSVRTLIRFA